MTIEPIKAHFLGTTLNDLTVPDCLLALEYLVGDGKTDDPEYVAERRRLIEGHFQEIVKRSEAFASGILAISQYIDSGAPLFAPWS